MHSHHHSYVCGSVRINHYCKYKLIFLICKLHTLVHKHVLYVNSNVNNGSDRNVITITNHE